MEEKAGLSFVFDIDGVLLDVRNSYYRTVQEAVRMLLGVDVSLEEILLFKQIRGFNDDWDIATALYGFYKYRCATDIGEFVRMLDGCGVRRVFELCDIAQEEVIMVRRMCKEIYGGIDACEFLFGFRPQMWLKKGLYNNEVVLFELSDIPKGIEFGIVTGRNEKESILALNILGWREKLDMSRVIHTDKGVKKPDSHALEMLFECMPTNLAIYFGDGMDDLVLVQNYRNNRGSVETLFCGIYDSLEKAKRFTKEGVDFVAPSLKDALSIVAHSGKLGDLSELFFYSQ